MDVLCDKCKKPMKKKGTLMMSNSKFEIYTCPFCGSEKKRAIGVFPG
jgi:hypothetical protein